MPHARGTQLDLLRNELTRTRTQLETETVRLVEEVARFRQQALDAILGRDRVKESRDRVRRRLTHAKAELKDRKGATGDYRAGLRSVTRQAERFAGS
ncbi:MAG: hypothetical protein GY822_29260 [Deltaproteobacteria bacterium]|nr:hypothetical protein [Deltaproteobacteria bacterium]